MKRFLAIVLAAAMLLPLVGCRLDEDGVYYAVDDYNDQARTIKKEMKSTERTLDPQQVYASLTYTEKMFYGTYELENWSKNKEDFLENAQFAEMEYCTIFRETPELKAEELSVLPVGIDAGQSCVYYVRGDESHEWAVLRFANIYGGREEVICTYKVEGNKIIFTPLDGFVILWDENGKRTGFEYTLGQDTLEYTFSFSGIALTLSNGQDSVTLLSERFSDNGYSSISLGGYLAEGSASVDGLDNISVSKSRKYEYAYFNLEDEERWCVSEAVAFAEDGWMLLRWTVRDQQNNETHYEKQFVCFPGDGYVMTLTDGENVYYYTDNYSTRELRSLTGIVAEEDQAELSQMEEEQIKQIVEKKANLIDDLAAAYEEAGLNVTIDRQTGEIAMDSAVLFGVNKADISQEGTVFLQKFMQVYASVVFSEAYTDFVSRIMVEGHTDTSGDYDMNLELSQKRAEGVMAYCLSEECGVAEYAQTLADMMQAQGYSYDRPVYDETGKVDMQASRRVSFRFIINVG